MVVTVELVAVDVWVVEMTVEVLAGMVSVCEMLGLPVVFVHASRPSEFGA